MLIYPPGSDSEYGPVVGGLTNDEFALVERALRAAVPPVRFLKTPEADTFPTVRRFTLQIHRDDRERAGPVINEVMARISPHLLPVERADREIAAFVRQFVRARAADDREAADLMLRYLCRQVQYLLERLLFYAKAQGSVDLWLDGISAQEVDLVPPLGLDLRGYIYCGRSSDGSQWREPFGAELRASAAGPDLEQFAARFGDRACLSAEGVIRADLTNLPSIGETPFDMRVGDSIPRDEPELVNWAIEFVKGHAAKPINYHQTVYRMFWVYFGV